MNKQIGVVDIRMNVGMNKEMDEILNKQKCYKQ